MLSKDLPQKFTRQSPRGPQTQTDELWNARKFSTDGQTAFDTEFLYWTRRFSVSCWTMWSWWTYSRKFEHIRDCVVFSYKKIWNKSTRFLKHTFKIKLHLCCIAWLCLCTICANLLMLGPGRTHIKLVLFYLHIKNFQFSTLILRYSFAKQLFHMQGRRWYFWHDIHCNNATSGRR